MRHSRETKGKCNWDLTNTEICEEALNGLSQSAENEIFADCIKCKDTGSE